MPSITITKVNPSMSQYITDFIDENCYDISDGGNIYVMPHVTPTWFETQLAELLRNHGYSNDDFAICNDRINQQAALISISWWEFNKVQLMTILWEK